MIKNNSFLIITLICLSLFTAQTSVLAASETKIAKVNMGLLTALHPKMALFDFQRMGFLKIEFGYNREKAEEQKMLLRTDEKLIAKANEALKSAEEEIMKQESLLRELYSKEGTHFLPDFSEEGRKLQEKLSSDLNDLLIKRRECEYALRYPEYTSPSETRKILETIETESVEAVRTIAKSKDFDIVLNSSVPVPYGYPVSYRPEVQYSTGPVGMDQINYYTILSVKPEGREEEAAADEMLKEWLSVLFRPSAQEMIPVKPWPLVMDGGTDVLPDALKILYTKYKIDDVTFDMVKDVLYSTGAVK